MNDYEYRGYNEYTCPHCGTFGTLELEQADDTDAPRAYWFRCEYCGGLSKQVWALVENVPTEG